MNCNESVELNDSKDTSFKKKETLMVNSGSLKKFQIEKNNVKKIPKLKINEEDMSQKQPKVKSNRVLKKKEEEENLKNLYQELKSQNYYYYYYFFHHFILIIFFN